MDAIIGFITLNNVNKSNEILLAYAVIAFASILALVYFNRINSLADFAKTEYQISDPIVYFAVFSLTLYILFSYAINPNAFLLFLSLLFTWIVQNKFSTVRAKPILNILLVILSSLLILTKAVTSTHYLPSIFILIAIFAVFLWHCGAVNFAVAAVLFSTRNFYSGAYEIADTFHAAEHFLASMELYKGFFTVFPNLGYLEEYPAYALVAVFKLLTGGIIQMSIMTARELIATTLILIIFSQINRQNRFLAVLFILVIPLGRISLLIALAYSIYISAIYTHISGYGQQLDKLNMTLFSLFPLLAAGLTPTYLLFPILAFAGMLPFRNIHYKQLITIAATWLLIFIIFNQHFIKYFVAYTEFSQLYDLAYSTTIATLNQWDLGFWMVLLFFTTVIVLGMARSHDNISVQIFKILIALFVLIKSADYGFGRIDPGFSRLVQVLICLVIISSYFSKRYSVMIGIILCAVGISYRQLDIPRIINKEHLMWLSNPKDYPVQLSSSNEQLASKISEFAAGQQVINYSNQPALTIKISNAKVPPFTTPYVTIGESAQNSVIGFMKTKPDAIVYLGHDFFTFDGVDVRLRAPLVFRYLAENYVYTSEAGNIYAIPANKSASEISGRIFFDQLDMKKSSSYFSNHAVDRFAYRQIIISCPQQEAGNYKIINESNTLYGELQCGINLVPEVFFMGEVKEIHRQL